VQAAQPPHYRLACFKVSSRRIRNAFSFFTVDAIIAGMTTAGTGRDSTGADTHFAVASVGAAEPDGTAGEAVIAADISESVAVSDGASPFRAAGLEVAERLG